MALNPFIGRSREWLETQLELAQEDLARGKTTSSWSAGDGSASKQVQMTPEQRIERILYALYLIDPTTYPITAIKRANRTQVAVYPHEDADA